jgi:hypothetical protein
MLVYGHFSLGSGVVESIPSYFYYVKLLNGGYKLKHIPTDICTIFRDENESPYIIAHYYNGIPSSRGIYGNVGDRNIIRIGNTYIDEETGYVHTEYVWYDRNGDVEIHIPSNSTIEEFIP